MSERGVALRLFLTCWVVYGMHFATNIVREHYPVFSLAERATLRVDPYLGLHPDLFEIEGRGAYINNNPGASLLAAPAYLLVRPAVDVVAARVAAARATQGGPVTAEYDTKYPMRVEFFRKVRERGLDVRFGLAAWSTHGLFMAPLGAAGALVMRALLLRLGLSAPAALWLALLYAFGTPVFFRSGFLNQNMLVAHATLFAFALLWRPDRPGGIEDRSPRLALAGVAAGTTLLCDYSGVVPLLALGLYAGVQLLRAHGPTAAAPRVGALVAGGALPVAVLLGYQQWAFGNPLFPAQRYMPDTAYSVRGWFGLTPPAPDLLTANLFDLRFGLFAFCPLLLLGVVGWAAALGRRSVRAEAVLALGIFLGLWLFASAVQFGRLQWNTGVRYMVPAVPLLFLATALALRHLPRPWAVGLGIASVAQSWALAMVREDVPTSLASALLAGVQLPWLSVLGMMGGQYLDFLGRRPPDPTLLVLLVGGLLACLWLPARRAPA